MYMFDTFCHIVADPLCSHHGPQFEKPCTRLQCQHCYRLLVTRPMVFNWGEIVPRERLYELWVRFCDLPDLEGDFSLQWGDFCRLEFAKILN